MPTDTKALSLVAFERTKVYGIFFFNRLVYNSYVIRYANVKSLDTGSPEHIYHACGRKRKYPTKIWAGTSAKTIRKKTGDRMRPYKCNYCDGWHLGHHKKPSQLKRIFENLNEPALEIHENPEPAHLEHSIT